jgi:hypothetical protein
MSKPRRTSKPNLSQPTPLLPKDGCKEQEAPAKGFTILYTLRVMLTPFR